MMVNVMKKLCPIIRRFITITHDYGFLKAGLDVYYRSLFLVNHDAKNMLIFKSMNGYKHPLCMRWGTSDYDCFQQIFIDNEYACLNGIRDPKLIVDCGAYVGYSTIWFLNRYPTAYSVALEPDPSNLCICQKNLSVYGKRVSLIHSAVWPYETSLLLDKQSGKGRWGTQVRECQLVKKGDTKAVDIYRILRRTGYENIDILKLDIEGSEKYIFSNNYEKWLDRVKNIVIEIHGEECREVFFDAMSRYDYELFHSGELTICKNIRPKMQRAKSGWAGSRG